jgi:hypothetical protein
LNRTKDELLRKFRNHVAGIIALGSAEARRIHVGPFESAAAYGQVMNNLSETADQLLSTIYDFLDAKELVTKPPHTNGAVATGAAQPQKVNR